MWASWTPGLLVGFSLLRAFHQVEFRLASVMEWYHASQCPNVFSSDFFAPSRRARLDKDSLDTHSLSDPTSIHSAFSFFVSPFRRPWTDLAVGQGGLKSPYRRWYHRAPPNFFCHCCFEEERLEFEDNDFSPLVLDPSLLLNKGQAVS
jgi:hypothetical protein